MLFKLSSGTKRHPFAQKQRVVVEDVIGVWQYYAMASRRQVMLEPSNEVARALAELYPYGMIVVHVRKCTPYQPDRSELRAHQDVQVDPA